jgi:hypothetical protein
LGKHLQGPPRWQASGLQFSEQDYSGPENQRYRRDSCPLSSPRPLVHSVPAALMPVPMRGLPMFTHVPSTLVPGYTHTNIWLSVPVSACDPPASTCNLPALMHGCLHLHWHAVQLRQHVVCLHQCVAVCTWAPGHNISMWLVCVHSLPALAHSSPAPFAAAAQSAWGPLVHLHGVHPCMVHLRVLRIQQASACDRGTVLFHCPPTHTCFNASIVTLESEATLEAGGVEHRAMLHVQPSLSGLLAHALALAAEPAAVNIACIRHRSHPQIT